jgi:E3 ubiquitin-protein ligase RGLG
MEDFDDNLTQRLFDNFQFVNFTEIGKRAAAKGYTAEKWEADFALSALMEIPDQYRTICKLGLLGKQQFSRPATTVNVVPVKRGPDASEHWQRARQHMGKPWPP